MTRIAPSKPTTYLLSAGVLFGEGIYDLREISSEQFFQMIEDGGTDIDCSPATLAQTAAAIRFHDKHLVAEHAEDIHAKLK